MLGVALGFALTSGDAVAQGPGKGQGPANYSVAAEMTVKGAVQELKRGPQQGMHVILKTSDSTLELARGPACHQTEKKYELARGDQIEAIGAKSTVDGRDVLLVREIKKGSETMTFRDAKGFPMWAGGGRR